MRVCHCALPSMYGSEICKNCLSYENGTYPKFTEVFKPVKEGQIATESGEYTRVLKSSILYHRLKGFLVGLLNGCEANKDITREQMIEIIKDELEEIERQEK